MKQQNLAVMKIIRIGIYLGRTLQKHRLTPQKLEQLQKVHSLLGQARSLIVLKPWSYSMCIAMLPQMDAILEGNPPQFALAA